MSIHILSLHHLTEEERQTIQSAKEDIVLHTASLTEAAPYLTDTNILLTYGQTDLTPLLPHMPNLHWVHALSSGVDGLLASEAFRNAPILLTNSRGIHGIPIAEHVLGIMLASSRCLFEAEANQKAHLWKRLSAPDELYEKTAAIIGLGSVGREIAKHLKNMGMKVLAIKQEMTIEPFTDKLYTPKELLHVLSAADYIIVALPLTEKTINLFTEEQFRAMKYSAYFINIARGPIVNESALCTALKNQWIRGAALDVFTTEPLPANSPLWDMPNLLITPHHAALSPYYMGRTLRIFIENLQHFPNTDCMINLVNKNRGY